MTSKRPIAFKCLGMKDAFKTDEGCHGCTVRIPLSAYLTDSLIDIVVKTPDRCVYGSCVKDDVVWIPVF